tara:strand:+ start:336 stop:590 length:255 start_codon:yes stop_codon:yes gene_type:complete
MSNGNIKFTFDIDDWNRDSLVINNRPFDVNVYADDDEQVRVIVMECEQGQDGLWFNNDVTIFNEAFDIGVTINGNNWVRKEQEE